MSKQIERLVSQAQKTQKNWFEAFKAAGNLHGYNYYEIPPELRYRYPAPGSCHHTKTDMPNLFKKHWKTPFRDSQFNIRGEERYPSVAEQFDHEISGLVELNAEGQFGELDKVLALDQQPKTDDLKLSHDGTALDSPEMVERLWSEFESAATNFNHACQMETPGHGDLETVYSPLNQVFWDRQWTGLECDARMRSIQVEMEYWIEKVVGAKQIEEKKLKMYKGTIKKW